MFVLVGDSAGHVACHDCDCRAFVTPDSAATHVVEDVDVAKGTVRMTPREDGTYFVTLEQQADARDRKVRELLLPEATSFVDATAKFGFVAETASGVMLFIPYELVRDRLASLRIWCEYSDRCAAAASVESIRALIKEYDGDSLHIVFSDQNHDRGAVAFCARFALEHRDMRGHALALAILALDDKDFDELLPDPGHR